MAEAKAGWEERDPLEIRIDAIQTTVDPEVKETDCLCGGTLRYGKFPFSAQWADHHWNWVVLEVGEVEGYKCDQSGDLEDCSVTLLLPEVSRELEWHIDKARGTLSLKQRLEGQLKGFSSE